MPTVLAQPRPEEAIQTTPLPLTTGVEIEVRYSVGRAADDRAYYEYDRRQRHPTLHRFKKQLTEAGLTASVDVDYHQRNGTLNDWSLGYDGSTDYEFRTPVFSTLEDATRQITTACKIFKEIGCTADDNCGLHVHLGTGSYTDEQVRKFNRFLLAHEDTFFSLVPESRRRNCYCERVPRIDNNFQRWFSTHPKDAWGPRFWFHQSRLGTTEVRLQRGSLDPERILSWICLLQQAWLTAQARPEVTKLAGKVFRFDQPFGDGVPYGYTTQLEPAFRKAAISAAGKLVRAGGKSPFIKPARKYARIVKFNE